MSKKIVARLSCLMIIMMLFIACSGSISTDLYVADIEDAAVDASAIYYTRAVLMMESPGSSSVEQLKEKIREWFRDVENFRETDIDFTSYLVADIMVPVVNSNVTTIDSKDDLFTIVATQNTAGETEFGFRFDRSVFDTMNRYIKDEFWSSLSIEDWDFSIDLKNDSRKTKDVVIHSLYADGEPVLTPKKFSVKNRDTLNLRFSDILRDYGFAQGEVMIGSLV